jgi:sialic acid synthase SpsE
LNPITIKNFKIGSGFEPFIVAEAGLNHNGEIQKAFEMIKVAKEAGVNAIKFQTFKADEFIFDTSLKHTYFSQGKKITKPQIELFKKCEFSNEEWFKIKEKCDKEKIMFLSTPENRSDLDLLLEIGVPAIKVGSDELINLPLLKDYALTGLPIILSSGMANLEEINDALKTVGTLDNYPTILLVTTSEYPTPFEDVNLRKFETLSKLFPNTPLGFSDHTQGFLASSLACAFGACFFEKHFTLSHDLEGPDHWFSEDPIGLKNWVNSIKTAYTMLGSKEVKPTEKELELRKSARRSIIALCNIEKGEKFNKNNIGLRRPGNDLPPKLIDQIYGLNATRRIPKGTFIKFSDFD